MTYEEPWPARGAASEELERGGENLSRLLMESPFLSSEFVFEGEGEAESRHSGGDAYLGGLLWAFRARRKTIRMAVFVPPAALSKGEVELLVYIHGLLYGVCREPRRAPLDIVSSTEFKLGPAVADVGRPMVLAVPLLQTERARTAWSAHGLNQPATFNAVMEEVLAEVGRKQGIAAPALSRLVLAGHSRAFGVLYPIARASRSSEMERGALARLADVWALDATYGTYDKGKFAEFDGLVAARSTLSVDVVYRQGSGTDQFKAITGKDRLRLHPEPRSLGHCAVPGKWLPQLLAGMSSPPAGETFSDETDFSAEWRAFEAESDWARPVAYEDRAAEEFESHTCTTCGGHEASAQDEEEADGAWYRFGEALDSEDSYETGESFAGEDSFTGEDSYEAEEEDEEGGRFDETGDGEWGDSEWGEAESEDEDEDEYEAFDSETSRTKPCPQAASPLDHGGLTPAEFKAVAITSTLETGCPGRFDGRTGNFDGQGLSFGLVNWPLGTGSLQPLLRAFAREKPDHWARVFGPDAALFQGVIMPDGKGSREAQKKFAIEQMNERKRNAKNQLVWKIAEPWNTYFGRLAEDVEFQKIQVRFVRDLLACADGYCHYFDLKSEMALAFMFDAVSSHGKAWFKRSFGKGKAAVQKRRVMIEERLAQIDRHDEKAVLNVIAEVLSVTSLDRWKSNVLKRKRWFTGGPAPRSGDELAKHVPSPVLTYTVSGPPGACPDPGKPRSSGAGHGAGPKAPVTRPPAPISHPEPRAVVASAQQSQSEAVRAAIAQASSGNREDVEAIRKTLRACGQDTASWFSGIVPDARFLGVKIRASGGRVAGVHRELFDRLQRAERALLAKHPGSTADQLGRTFGIKDIAGIRPPKKATGGSQISLHCFGLAIDINHDTNPFVGNQKARDAKFQPNRSPAIIKRAMQLLHGTTFNVESGAAADPGAAWDVHHKASEALAAYLRLMDDIDGARVQALIAAASDKGIPTPEGGWKKWIALDRGNIRNWDFQHHPNPWQAGYMDLPRDLVVALVEAGLGWGGQYNKAKDIMHFGFERGTITPAARH